MLTSGPLAESIEENGSTLATASLGQAWAPWGLEVAVHVGALNVS